MRDIAIRNGGNNSNGRGGKVVPAMATKATVAAATMPKVTMVMTVATVLMTFLVVVAMAVTLLGALVL